MSEFPAMKGFSVRNLKYIRQWHMFYRRGDGIGQQAVAQFTQIPWGHNIVIITECKNAREALFYVKGTMAYNWSRNMLAHQIESGLYRRKGKSMTNFAMTLPKPQSDLAQQTLKDPYVFNFLSMSAGYNERDLETALFNHVTNFLLELGAGFSFIGRQFPVQVGEEEFFVDLLFYHTRLHCYVVVELKTTRFAPANAGQLNFYVKAVDSQLRKAGDAPTIGLILCKGKDSVVAEYALSDINKPIGVSEYALTHRLPKNLKSDLPTIKEIEEEFRKPVDKPS